MVTTQAVVADVVPPRARGRYQGIFGAAFGFASIAGPLVGGYFTTHWTWRGIFYINLPVGIIALVVLAVTLPAQSSYARHAIDSIGAAVLALTLALIGSVTYLPVFLQIVKGLSPTESGLRMVPLMGGTLMTSILAGQLVSRTGKYKLFPIIGTTIVTISLLLISRMTAETSTLAASTLTSWGEEESVTPGI